MIAVTAEPKAEPGFEAAGRQNPSIPKRSVNALLEPVRRLASVSSKLQTLSDGPSGRAVPRFLFLGAQGGGEPINIGIFAGIHGDEPEGVHALLRFISLLDREPEVAEGFRLFIYPICNSEGFEDRTRHSRSGKDLNREFWRGSAEPEVKVLEVELLSRKFQGIISLHTDDTAAGFYGFVQGATLTKDLIEPALSAAEQFLPLDRSERIDGFQAQNGIIKGGYDGMLSAPPHVRPKPFEIVLETPKEPPAYLKEAALVAALRTIVVRYRQFIAYATNI